MTCFVQHCLNMPGTNKLVDLALNKLRLTACHTATLNCRFPHAMPRVTMVV